MEKGRLVLCASPQALYESGEIDRVLGVRGRRGEGAWYFMPHIGGG